MTTIADVKTEVDRVFDASGAPYWPNPHADNSIAAEEEYSRVTDPQKYHVLVLRLQAWQTVLAKMCGVDVDTRAKGLGTLRQRWSSPHSDTLPLYASVVTLDQVPFVGLSVTSDTDPFDIVPDCACDACDYGSQDLLRVLDADLTAVVDGSLVVVTGPGEKMRSAHYSSRKPSLTLFAVGTIRCCHLDAPSATVDRGCEHVCPVI